MFERRNLFAIFVRQKQNTTTMAKKKGGIQLGTTASSEESKKIDKQVKKANQELFAELKESYPGLTYQSKLKKEQIPGGVGACQPDGGIWLLNGTPIIASEAKKQGKGGNAIERWYNNSFILRTVNKDILYATFATGEGVLKDSPVWSTLHIAVEGKYNMIREKSESYGQDGVSVFLSKEDFEYDFVKETMRQIVMKAIEKSSK